MSQEVIIRGEGLQLLPERAIYWSAKRVLLIADAHFGKVSHFRREGLRVPQEAMMETFRTLDRILTEYDVERVLFLGDLFHSDWNQEHNLLKEILTTYGPIRYELVLGNHDILSQDAYRQMGLEVYKETAFEYPFVFSHMPLTTVPDGYFNLSGHVHPGVELVGKGRQKLTLPCFYFAPEAGILPAFNEFSGKYIMQPTVEDRVFVVLKERILEVSGKPTAKATQPKSN